MKLQITAVGKRGLPITDTIIERETREQCLREGIDQILQQGNFPPEAIQIYRAGLARDLSRDEVCDYLLEKFSLQFFSKEAGEVESRIPPAEERIKAAAQNGATASPAAVAASIFNLKRSPRQLLQSELKEIKLLLSKSGLKLKEVQKEHDFLVQRAAQCRELLKRPAKPRIVHNRTETHP